MARDPDGLDELVEVAPRLVLDVDKATGPAREAFAELGVELTSNAATTDESIADLRAWLGGVPPLLRANAVLMDTTTIAAVEALTVPDGGAWLTPLTLWDLATFATAVVLHDRVFVMASQEVDIDGLNRRLGHDVLTPVAIPAPIDDWGLVGAAGVVQGLWLESGSYIKELLSAEPHDVLGLEREAVRSGWEHVLGTPVQVDDLFDPDEQTSWPSPSVNLLTKLAEATSPVLQRTDLALPGRPTPAAGKSKPLPAPRARAVISECNRRSYFNERLAGLLELPYLPNAARLPFRRHQFHRSVAVQARIDQVIQGEYAAVAAQAAGVYALAGAANMTLPVTLAAALGKVSAPAEILECLGELRMKGVQFRRRRAELDEAIAKRDLKTAADLRLALEQDAPLWRDMLGFGPVAGAVGATLSLLAGGPFALVLGGLSVLAGGAAALPEPARKRLAWRLLRPQFRFVSQLGESAREVTDAMPKISAMWGIPPAVQGPFAQRIEALGGLDTPQRR